MELKLNSTLRKSIYNATKFMGDKYESYSDIRLKSNGCELYIYSTNGCILYTAGYGIRTEPLDVAFRVEPSKLKQVDGLLIDSSKATFTYNGKPVFTADVEHNPVRRIDFENFFIDPGFASFYTTKSNLSNALMNYKHLLVNHNKGLVPLHMYISDEGIKLTSSDGVNVNLNATDISGEYNIEFDALKLRKIIQALYEDVFIELFKPVDTPYIRIMSEEVWFILAPMKTKE